MENPGQYVVIPLSIENIISQKSWTLWEKRKKDDPERDNATQLNLNQPYSALRWQIVGSRSSQNMAGKLQASFTLRILLVSFSSLQWRKTGINSEGNDCKWDPLRYRNKKKYLKKTGISKCPLSQMYYLLPTYLAFNYSYSTCSQIPQILRYVPLNLIPSHFTFSSPSFCLGGGESCEI